MTERHPITFADSVPDLPGSDFAARLRALRIAREFAAQSAGNDNRRNATAPSHTGEKSMVEQDRPFPVLRPSPALAAEVDAASFEMRLEMERVRTRTTNLTTSQTVTGRRPMSDDQTTPRRPEETLREGPLKAAIWRNEGENGAYHQVTLARTYKDRDGNLQDTQSFRARDMLGLSELARRAHHEVHDRDRALFKEQRHAEEVQAQTRGKGHTR